MTNLSSAEIDVIIIGGGATGAGITRDCARRGLRAALIERDDIATGATGRNHGLLHSGARYAVSDAESARECISENRILRRIARHCIEPTGGLFITLPEDDPAWQQRFVDACQQAGIDAGVLDPHEARRLEPSLNPALIGTTSTRLDYRHIDDTRVTAQEVDTLLREGAKLAPRLADTRILRAYAGVRPLVASDDAPSGRNISRGIVLLDHAARDGMEGFITITGGKLMTYRLMAEWATDAVCRKLGVTTPCTTAHTPLPGSQASAQETLRKVVSLPAPLRGSAVWRHGDRAPQWLSATRTGQGLVCECEAVTVDEVRYAVASLGATTLMDLRRRTRIGMGTCQGELCACRAAGLLARFEVASATQSLAQLSAFLNERWKGIRPIAWGDALRESEFTRWVYLGLGGLEKVEDEDEI